MPTTEKMTKSEREDTLRHLRAREKAMKSAARQRSTEKLAELEAQMAAEHAFDDDEIWEEAARLARAEVAKAQERVAARCKELGIPRQFAPGLELHWRHRGYDNALKQRRDELRKAAVARVAAMEQATLVQIEVDSVKAQEQIVMAGLTSEAALAFINALPSVEELMPTLSYSDIAGEADPPLIEQLVTSNALRQRRFRERQKALRNADVTADNEAGDDQS